MSTLILFVEMWFAAASDPKRRRSVWRHPLWVIRFYWRHARLRIARRTMSNLLPLGDGLSFWAWEVSRLTQEVAAAVPPAREGGGK
jgi:hypothetical protein